MKRLKFDVTVPVTIFKEGNVFIAHSPVLDIATSAHTFEKAQSRFTEAVEIFFEELIDTGTLDDVLSNLGWQKVRSKWAPPIQVYSDMQRISVPLAA